MDNQNIVFSDINNLISHLKFLMRDSLTPIRLQKSLYFLFAFYGASYGQLNVEETEEGSLEGGSEDAYPRYLFEEHFEAWKFGPVVPEVYRNFKNKEIAAVEWAPNDPKSKNIKLLIEEVVNQLKDMGDFELVERSHEDKSWREAYDKGQSTPMINDQIIEEYYTPV